MKRKRKQIEKWSTNLKTVIDLNEKKNCLGEDWWFNTKRRGLKNNKIVNNPKMILGFGLPIQTTIFRATWN